jgi:hypothetical protein
MKPQIVFPILALLIGIARAEMGRPKDIPEAGRIRVDGQLNDWRNVEWTPLDKTLAGSPVNISNAQWALQWDDEPSLYIAVRYDDASIVLQDRYVNSNAQDRVEIFVRGDTGSKPADYSKQQNSAQHYIFGLSKNKITSWRKLAGMERFPAHNPAKAAVRLDGRTFTYEIMVPVYDKFDAKSRRRSETTEVYADLEIGVDITITDAGAKGFAGVMSENMLEGKERNANRIAEHTLGE